MKKSDFLANSRFDEARQRGDEFHSAVCEYWKTGQAGTSEKFQDWIDSFLSYPNLKNWEPMAVEFPVIDRRFNIAGTLDLLLKHKENGRIALCDYKTKNEKFSKANHRPQLGGYLSLLWQQYPQLDIDSCRIYWVSPKETTTNEYSPIDCLESYEAARSFYFQKQLPF